MKKTLRLLIGVALLTLSSLALAGGGGSKSAPKPPPPPPPPPMPAEQKAPTNETFRRRNTQDGRMGNSSTMLTDLDAESKEDVNLGGNTLLGS
jgi:hypothetical protein